MYLYRLCKEELTKTEKHHLKLISSEKELVYPSIISALENKLGIGRSFSRSEAKLFHVTCAFEVAIYNDSTLCAFFDELNLKRMEYLHDLLYVDKDNGRYYNGNATCDIIRDLVSTIKSNMKSSKPITKLYFSHSGKLEILKLKSLM